MRPAIRFAKTGDGVRIAYSIHGDGPPLVFVRGWASHIELMWDHPPFRAYFEALAKRFRVVRYDLRGNGLSDRRTGPIGLDGLVADLETVMDAADVKVGALFGNGYGGFPALAYTARNPDRVSELVLYGCRARPEHPRPDRWPETFRVAPDAAFLMVSANTDRSQEAVSKQGTSRVSMSAEVAAELYALAEVIDVSDALPHITCPALVMHPRELAIPFALGRELAADLTQAQFVPLEGGSWNPWSDPRPSLAAMSEFFGVALELEASHSEPSAGGLPNAFKREGEYWTVRFGDTSVRLRDSKGMRYVHELLRHTGREFHVAQLVEIVDGRAAADGPRDDDDLHQAGDTGDIIDAATREAYRSRLSELRDELDEAKLFGDDVRASRAQEEMDAIAGELASALGIGGRPRKAGDPTERARKAVTNRIRDALTKVQREHPSLGRHLANSVKTGVFCAYAPDTPVTWDT